MISVGLVVEMNQHTMMVGVDLNRWVHVVLELMVKIVRTSQEHNVLYWVVIL